MMTSINHVLAAIVIWITQAEAQIGSFVSGRSGFPVSSYPDFSFRYQAGSEAPSSSSTYVISPRAYFHNRLGSHRFDDVTANDDESRSIAYLTTRPSSSSSRASKRRQYNKKKSDSRRSSSFSQYRVDDVAKNDDDDSSKNAVTNSEQSAQRDINSSESPPAYARPPSNSDSSVDGAIQSDDDVENYSPSTTASDDERVDQKYTSETAPTYNKLEESSRSSRKPKRKELSSLPEVLNNNNNNNNNDNNHNFEQSAAESSSSLTNNSLDARRPIYSSSNSNNNNADDTSRQDTDIIKSYGFLSKGYGLNRKSKPNQRETKTYGYDNKGYGYMNMPPQAYKLGSQKSYGYSNSGSGKVRRQGYKTKQTYSYVSKGVGSSESTRLAARRNSYNSDDDEHRAGTVNVDIVSRNKYGYENKGLGTRASDGKKERKSYGYSNTGYGFELLPAVRRKVYSRRSAPRENGLSYPADGNAGFSSGHVTERMIDQSSFGQNAAKSTTINAHA